MSSHTKKPRSSKSSSKMSGGKSVTPKSVYVKDPASACRTTTFNDLHKGNLTRHKSPRKSPRRKSPHLDGPSLAGKDRARGEYLSLGSEISGHTQAAARSDTWRAKAGLPPTESVGSTSEVSGETSATTRHARVLLAENNYLRAKVNHFERSVQDGVKVKLTPGECWKKINYITNVNLASVSKLNEEITARILRENGLGCDSPVRLQLHDKCELFVSENSVLDLKEQFEECLLEQKFDS